METCTSCNTAASETTHLITDPYGNKFCLDCCRKMDLLQLKEEDNSILLFDSINNKITNSPGTLLFDIIKQQTSVTPNNRIINTIWFIVGEDRWYGKNYGKSKLIHCKKLHGRKQVYK